MNILLVSERDVCRGPMARALGQRIAREMGVSQVLFDSAGIDVSDGCRPSRDLIEFLREQQLNIAKHQSKALASPQVRWADLILCMTRSIADRTRILVGPSHCGKVVVLNEAVGLGHKEGERNIDPPLESTFQAVLTLFSRLKAATGRLVRLMDQGNMMPSDFGAVGDDLEPERFLDDPHLRSFLGRYIAEFIERAFDPPFAEEIQKALEVLGRPVSTLDLEELIRGDLRGSVIQLENGRWDVTEAYREDRVREKRKKAEESRKRERETLNREAKSESTTESIDESIRMTQREALEVLAIRLDTPYNDAAKKYRQLLMRFHPDKFHDDDQFRAMAERKTKRINAAWSLIKDRLVG